MNNVHERKQCGVPVIIEGETGVGKTEMLKMMSILWNTRFIKGYRIAAQEISNEINRWINDIIDTGG